MTEYLFWIVFFAGMMAGLFVSAIIAIIVLFFSIQRSFNRMSATLSKY